jgi:hypothetical protein
LSVLKSATILLACQSKETIMNITKAAHARNIHDPQVKKPARRLLRIVEGMKAGPNLAVWAELTTIENGARAAYQSAT